MFVLDTNAVIAVLNESNPAVTERLVLEFSKATPILLSSIVLYELRYGVSKSKRQDRNEALLSRFLDAPLTLIPFEQEDAHHAGDIRAHLERHGDPIGPYDILIAAQARYRAATLVTSNLREFRRVPDLIVENWAA